MIKKITFDSEKEYEKLPKCPNCGYYLCWDLEKCIKIKGDLRNE